MYGPMTRAELVRLVESGRLFPSDMVSLAEEPWIALADYLQSTADETAHAAAPVNAPGRWKDAGQPAVAAIHPAERNLRVVRGGKLFGPMARSQVESLLAAGRMDGDDLIAAIDGPWMVLGDFLGMRPVVVPRPADPAAPASMPDASDEIGLVEELEVLEDEVDELLEILDDPETPYEPQRTPVVELPDNWYAKVRGLHSCNLRKRHLRGLMLAKEITMNSLVSHVSWDNNEWKPIREIPQLADLETMRL